MNIAENENIKLIDEHRKAVAPCSFMQHMRKVSPTYEKIISKGKEIVPDVLKYLQDNEGGMSVMLLLWDILKMTPYQPEKVKNHKNEEIGMLAFNVTEARQAWIDWGIKEKLIQPKNNDSKKINDEE